MTGYFFLDWAIIAVSLFNTIVMVWLGLTVLLNADRRSAGVWLMSGGLLSGAAFFVSHTAILGQSPIANLDGLNFWWQFGWIPVTVAPFAWYVVTLWFSGFWDRPRAGIYWRHAPWLVLTSVLGFVLSAILLFAAPIIPSYENVIHLNLSGTPTFYGIPVLLIVIPAFSVLCMALSLDVLMRPAPAKRPISEVARQRSRPWLLATAAALLVVSLLVIYFVFRLVDESMRGSVLNVRPDVIGLLDLGLAALIAGATLLLGQAIVSYEVFTGRALPRRGLTRHWRAIVVLAAGYSWLIAWSIASQLRPIYSLLLTTLLMVTFYAMYSWRTFVEREQYMRALRPFVNSQRLVTHLINPRADVVSRAQEVFRATCRDVLATERAQLLPLGPLAPMVGEPLAYPPDETPPPIVPPAEFHTGIVPLDPGDYVGYRWAIPLWAERGLIGALFVGRKFDGGLYAQEEFDVAQASGERVVDMLAGEQMARRLMQLQQKQLATHRVTDLHTRRTLHDMVLPALHSSILQLGSTTNQPSAVGEAIASLSEIHQQVSDLIRFAGGLPMSGSEQTDLQKTLRSLVEQEFAKAFDQIEWKTSGIRVTSVDPLVKDVLLGAVREIIRNAVVHGRGANDGYPLRLTVEIDGAEVVSIRISDNGVGIGQNGAHDNGGSGSGLALHRTLLAVVGGTCSVEPGQSGGTTATIALPWTVLAGDPP